MDREQGQHFSPTLTPIFFLSLSLSLHPSHKFFYPSPLVSNLIFITAESLKQFTCSASYMKIDNCDPPFLPGKQKRRDVVTWDCMLSMSVCEGRGATGVNGTQGGGGGGDEG